ncbi:AAC(3)-I family aminoglycoside N-acetyltransferase [Devosia chinhatensis]|uniref:Gentamicin 3'-acetyltransferase n=1 Tax=Devosia chinhatensis TaxID=429727 RepID=A0A0F5FIK5_9HYPH|nr:AAC(3)-I family aminoglycoside N-acetyltransferase [Devosia chinhatensis]KKB08676.1 gentamicin 3'-acetyltransferase [Devosia chinhatensis]
MAIWQVKRLGPADLIDFRGMNALFGTAFEDAQTWGANPPSDTYAADLLGKDHVFALAATKADSVVGALVAYELPKFESERSEVYIYDLAVAESHRRQGIATALIERLCSLAAERGAWVVYVQADYGDDPAVALYTKLGAREDVMHFDIPVRMAQRSD